MEFNTINQSAEAEIAKLRQDIMAGNIADPEPTDIAPLPPTYLEAESELIEALQFVEEMNRKLETKKAEFLAAMEEAGVKRWVSDRLTISRVEPSIRFTFDSKRLKKEHEDIYNAYLKSSETKSSIRFTIKQ